MGARGLNLRKFANFAVQRVQDQRHVNFEAMPTNNGKLVHTAVRYALHKYFVQRHSWSVRGLPDLG